MLVPSSAVRAAKLTLRQKVLKDEFAQLGNCQAGLDTIKTETTFGGGFGWEVIAG